MVQMSMTRGWMVLFVFLFVAPNLSNAQEVDSLSESSFPNSGLRNAYNFEPIVQKFCDIANRKTGLTCSFIGGQSDITQMGANTYDMSLWAMATPYGRRVIHTYAQNSIESRDQNSPQTASKSYTPGGGVLSFIRLSGMTQYGWWNTWEWSVKAGENAWIGIAATRQYVQSQDDWALDFAKQRADFILSLQDIDGAVRMGPRGQYFPGLAEGWWSIKSTENNESCLYFLDQLFVVTKDQRYKKAADRIYQWLMTRMFDARLAIFHRGAVYKEGSWRVDGHQNFSPDTLTFAPIERMLNDTNLGVTPVERVNLIARMMYETEKKVGVFNRDRLMGISFSSSSKRYGIVSPEWTAQYILICNYLAEAYRQAGNLDISQKLIDKRAMLLASMKAWYVQNNYTLPYALYSKNGYAAENVSTGHGWNTPDSQAALSSTIYFGFAAKGFDPLRDLIRY